MRLAVIAGFLVSHGGAARVILEIAKHFDAPIFAFRYSLDETFAEFRDLHVEVPEKGLLSRTSTATFSKLASLNYFYNLKLDGYDIINTHGLFSNCARNRNSPAIWYCHSPDRFAYTLHDMNVRRLGLLRRTVYEAKSLGVRHLDSRLVPRIEHIFANSSTTRSNISKYLKHDSEVLHPGVHTEKFSCKSYEQFFFYPSRLVPEKRFEYAIEAFKRFSSGRKDWKLVICGPSAKGSEDYFEKLKSLSDDSIIIKTGLSDEELNELYSRCYTVLFPPINEDLGLVPLEGLASSKPVIAVNEGGPKETVSDAVDGFLVNSPKEMAQRMELLAKNPDLCAEMGKAGRDKVKKQFTWERFLKRFEERAEELAKG